MCVWCVVSVSVSVFVTGMETKALRILIPFGGGRLTTRARVCISNFSETKFALRERSSKFVVSVGKLSGRKFKIMYNYAKYTFS